MSRILTSAQKNIIYQAIPTSYTVGSVTYSSVSKKYANQMTAKHSTYPVVVLNFSEDGLQGDIDDMVAGNVYHKAMLTIHILTKNKDDSPTQSGAVAAEGIAQSIMDTAEGWTTPLSGDIRVFDIVEDISPLQNLGRIEDMFDYVITIDLWHT